ncbi:hypothetical protein COCNU_scaffold000158G000010 [Cocos nucifera]|nr:hypothetical protein [Cocos nucifera]
MASRIAEAELKVIEVEKVVEERIIKAWHLAMEAFKVFKEFNEARIAFNQEVFYTILEISFDNCHHQVVAQLPVVNLFFLDEDEEEEAIGESIPSELMAAEEQVGEKPMVVGVSPSPTIGAFVSMPTPIEVPTGLSGTIPSPVDLQNKEEGEGNKQKGLRSEEETLEGIKSIQGGFSGNQIASINHLAEGQGSC